MFDWIAIFLKFVSKSASAINDCQLISIIKCFDSTLLNDF